MANMTDDARLSSAHTISHLSKAYSQTQDTTALGTRGGVPMMENRGSTSTESLLRRHLPFVLRNGKAAQAVSYLIAHSIGETSGRGCKQFRCTMTSISAGVEEEDKRPDDPESVHRFD